MRFILFYANIDSFNYFSLQIKKELEQRGHEVLVLDFQNDPLAEEGFQETLFAALEPFLKEPLDAVICYDRIGCHNEGWIKLWDNLGALVINILMDSPLAFSEIHEHPPKKYIEFCCDRDHVAFIKRYYGDTVPNVHFLPHFSDPPKEDEEHIPWQDREWDVLFCGTYRDPAKCLSEMQHLNQEGFLPDRILKESLRHLLSHSGATLEDALDAALVSFSMELLDRQRLVLLRAGNLLCDYLRVYWRDKVIYELGKAGIDLLLLGGGWEGHPVLSYRNVRYGGQIAFPEGLKAIGNARICLNVMPWFKDGTHDRIFSSLLRGAVPLTDGSKYLHERFTDGADIAFYDLDRLSNLPEKIRHILSSPDEAARILRNGKRKVMGSYTWKQCVDAILRAEQE